MPFFPHPRAPSPARGRGGVWASGCPFSLTPPAPSPARGRGGVWASGCFFLPACLLSPAAPHPPVPRLLLPLIPRPPFNPHGEKGEGGVPMPFFPHPRAPSPARGEGEFGRLDALFPSPPAPSPARGRGGVWASGCFFLPACLLSPAAPHPPVPRLLLPLIPRPPFNPHGEKGEGGVPMPFFPHPPCLSRVEFSGAMRGLRHSRAFCPSSPQPPSPLVGEGGSLGVLMPETGDGTQGLPQKPTPVSTPLPPSPARGRGGVWASGCTPEARAPEVASLPLLEQGARLWPAQAGFALHSRGLMVFE
jgi:hypothetical protein